MWVRGVWRPLVRLHYPPVTVRGSGWTGLVAESSRRFEVCLRYVPTTSATYHLYQLAAFEPEQQVWFALQQSRIQFSGEADRFTHLPGQDQFLYTCKGTVYLYTCIPVRVLYTCIPVRADNGHATAACSSTRNFASQNVQRKNEEFSHIFIKKKRRSHGTSTPCAVCKNTQKSGL